MHGEILLIDDDPMIRTVVADDLSEADFLVHTASSETEAFSVLAACPDIRVALVDYCLPRPIGIAVCRQITEHFPHVGVALFTGYSELAGVRKGDDDIAVLPKSLRHSQLVAALLELLQGRAPRTETNDLASRAEILWQREARRETVTAVGRAMHSHFDPALKEPLPSPMTQTVLRLGNG